MITTFVRWSNGIPVLLTQFPLACSRVTRNECPEGDKGLGDSKCQEDFPEEMTIVLSGQSLASLQTCPNTCKPTKFPTKSLQAPAAQKGRKKCFSSPVSPLAKYQATHHSARTHPQLLQA